MNLDPGDKKKNYPTGKALNRLDEEYCIPERGTSFEIENGKVIQGWYIACERESAACD